MYRIAITGTNTPATVLILFSPPKIIKPANRDKIIAVVILLIPKEVSMTPAPKGHRVVKQLKNKVNTGSRSNGGYGRRRIIYGPQNGESSVR
jgi:hypothetical protein